MSEQAMCEQLWEFDVNFDVMCTQPRGHQCFHTGTAWGNGSVPAAIVWGTPVEGEPTP